MTQTKKKRDAEGSGGWGSATSHKRLLRAVMLSERLLLSRLERALLHEEEIERLMEGVERLSREEGYTEKERRELLASLSSLRCEDLSKLVSIIGALSEREEALRGGAGRGESIPRGEEAVRFEDL